MSLPSRMNLVDIKIRQLIKPDEEFIDDDFIEPVHGRRFEEEVTVKGQPNFSKKRFQELTPSGVGDISVSRVYIIFKEEELKKADLSLKKGDRIVSVAGRDCLMEIVEIRPESPIGGKFKLIFAELEEVPEERVK